MRRAAAAGFVLVLVLVLMASALPAQAQPADPQGMVKHGLALRRERRDAEALAEFRHAYAIDPAPRTLAQIALAEQGLGQWVDAENDLEKALQASVDPWIASNHRILEAGLQAIRGHLGILDVEADVSGAELWVNGARVGPLPLAGPLRVEAGSLVIEVRAAGYAPARRMTSVEPAGNARETIHLVPLEPPPLLPSVPPSRPADREIARVPPRESTGIVTPADRPMLYSAFVFLGAGVVGLAAGTYFGLRTFTIKNRRDSECTGLNGSCSPEGVILDHQARTLAIQSTAWFAAGLVAAGAGVTLLWMSRSRTVVPGPTALQLRLDVGPDRAFFALGVGW
jgi:hypothetical protein